jgi:hypothetical protein
MMTPLLKVAVALQLTELATPVQSNVHFAATKTGGVALFERRRNLACGHCPFPRFLSAYLALGRTQTEHIDE